MSTFALHFFDVIYEWPQIKLVVIPTLFRYTAAAIASIAYREPVGLVDGNVIRVVARLRKIGADSNTAVRI